MIGIPTHMTYVLKISRHSDIFLLQFLFISLLPRETSLILVNLYRLEWRDNAACDDSVPGGAGWTGQRARYHRTRAILPPRRLPPLTPLPPLCQLRLQGRSESLRLVLVCDI